MIYLVLGLHFDQDNSRIVVTDDFGNLINANTENAYLPHAYEYEAPEPKPMPQLF